MGHSGLQHARVVPHPSSSHCLISGVVVAGFGIEKTSEVARIVNEHPGLQE